MRGSEGWGRTWSMPRPVMTSPQRKKSTLFSYGLRIQGCGTAATRALPSPRPRAAAGGPSPSALASSPSPASVCLLPPGLSQRGLDGQRPRGAEVEPVAGYEDRGRRLAEVAGAVVQDPQQVVLDAVVIDEAG